MEERISKWLRPLLALPAMALQYERFAGEPEAGCSDPLMEEKHEYVRGLVHKYPNRALIKVSYLCAAHCRFCTRIRQIGDPAGTLNDADIQGIANYLRAHPEIDDVILSGGDPLFTPGICLKLLQELDSIPSVRVFRIGTRLPLQEPESLFRQAQQKVLEQVKQMAATRPFYILIHAEHPDELQPESVAAIQELRRTGAVLLSQTVFLRGINDEEEVLFQLFQQLFHLGVQPYYLYRCDAVQGLERFRCDPDKEKAIAAALRKRLSGIACPLFVEDIENGYGKMPVG